MEKSRVKSLIILLLLRLKQKTARCRFPVLSFSLPVLLPVLIQFGRNNRSRKTSKGNKLSHRQLTSVLESRTTEPCSPMRNWAVSTKRSKKRNI